MKKIIEKITALVRILYKIIPFFLGIYCYYPFFLKNGTSIYPFADSIYSSLKLYYGCVESGVSVGIELQIARFLALAATLSILINAFNKLQDILNRAKLISHDTAVVYGSSVYAEYLYNSLPRSQRVKGGSEVIDHAEKYILMFSSDKENLGFYNDNYGRLAGKKIYLLLESTTRQCIDDPKITVFSIAENCARQYWKQFPVERSEKIAVIGFGSVGQNILTFGLQMNLIDPKQHFEYHIFGDASDFRKMHTELNTMLPDEIIFYDEGIGSINDLSDFDRVIICGDENENITTVAKLLEFLSGRPKLYVYAPNGDIITKLFGSDDLYCFGLASETASIDMILNESSMENARRQHNFYVSQYGGVPWEKLDAFKRYSNVSSADYLYMIKSLSDKNVPLDILAELEHMRWCRYHYLHNWKYGDKRNDKERIHNCLVPFSCLSEDERRKDIEAIKSKL